MTEKRACHAACLHKGENNTVNQKKCSFLKLFVFVVLAALGLMAANHILMDKEAKKGIYAIRYEKKDTIDVVFFGNSHANNGFLPMELWDDYGYTAYSMTMMSQTFPLIYYCAEDAVRLQAPELMVVDIFAATSYSNDFDNMHKTVDCLTFPTRMKAIREFVPENKKTEYYFPLYLYHDRWDELEAKDVLPYFLRYAPKQNARKGVTLVQDQVICKKPEEAIRMAFSDEKCELSDDARYWYHRLKALCDANGCELLFVVIPYEAPVGGTEEATIEQMKLYNATEQWCQENGVGYVNLFRNIDDMDFNFATDMQDVSHVNILGALKVTDEVGKYIHEYYKITDSREISSVKEDWDLFYQLYETERDQAIAGCGGSER